MTTTTFWAYRRMRALTRSSARTGSWPAGIIPTSRETTARSPSSRPPAPTRFWPIRGGAARTTPSDPRPRSPTAGRGEWFADEVAIDFPSVSDLLDRMRHAFFGANALEELSAEIVLSPLEAFAGTTIPMGIPVRQTCLRLRRPRRNLAGVVRARAAAAATCGRSTTSSCASRPASAAASGSVSR